MKAAYENDVEKFVFLGSSCIYPRDCAQPIKEEYLMTGQLEPSNSAYAVAKIAGIELINSYRKEYGLGWISLMPTNLYGINDNFKEGESHVLPAFIRRFIEAVENDLPAVTMWGTGQPMREFLHVDDLARACLFLMETYSDEIPLNIGSGTDITIRELAEMVREVVQFNGEIIWDTSKPDGTPRKLLDVSRIHDFGWSHEIELRQGISDVYEWYLSNL
jgi:GDP-L-fucose synthase